MILNTNPNAKRRITFIAAERRAMEKVATILETLARQDFDGEVLPKEASDMYAALLGFLFMDDVAMRA